MARVYLETYGCTLNRADSDMMEALLASLGYSVTGLDEADVIILNTCSSEIALATPASHSSIRLSCARPTQ